MSSLLCALANQVSKQSLFVSAMLISKPNALPLSAKIMEVDAFDE